MKLNDIKQALIKFNTNRKAKAKNKSDARKRLDDKWAYKDGERIDTNAPHYNKDTK